VRGVQSFLTRLDAPGRPRIVWEAQAAAEIHKRINAAVASPLMVALAGMPGAGKTVATSILERLLGPSCLVVPADGFHIPLATLRQRPDADDAVYRRGAPDTFDPDALRERLLAISRRSPASSPVATEGSLLEEVPLPGFEHSVGDPIDGAVMFKRSKHKVVIVEGLYLLHDDHNWEGISDLFDFRIYLDADIDECIAGLKERNKVIPGYTPEEVEVRCDRVDRHNATIVKKTSSRADLSVRSARSSGSLSPSGAPK